MGGLVSALHSPPPSPLGSRGSSRITGSTSVLLNDTNIPGQYNSTGRLLEGSGVCVSECLVCRMSKQDNEVHSGMRSEGTVRDGSKGQGQSVDEPHDKSGDESPLLKWRGRGLGIEWPNIKVAHREERAHERAGTEEYAGNRIGEDTERSGEGIEGFGCSTTWRDAWRNIEVASANVAELPTGKVGMVTEGEAAEPRMKFERYGVCFGGGVKGPSLSSPPMAKRLGDAQVYCHNPRPSPPVLLSQGGLHLLPPEHVSLLTSSLPQQVLDIDIRGAADAVTCSSTYFEDESTVDTPARPSMLAQGVRFEERVLAGEMFQEDDVDKERHERERLGELRRGAVSVLRCQSFADGAGGKGRDPQAHCGADTVSLLAPSSMTEDVPRLCASWRQVECQRAAQQEHKEARERVQREAQDRVFSALVAVGASSPTLRQARSAMVSQTVVR